MESVITCEGWSSLLTGRQCSTDTDRQSLAWARTAATSAASLLATSAKLSGLENSSTSTAPPGASSWRAAARTVAGLCMSCSAIQTSTSSTEAGRSPGTSCARQQWVSTYRIQYLLHRIYTVIHTVIAQYLHSSIYTLYLNSFYTVSTTPYLHFYTQ